jgi:hypothetical protein
VCATGADRKADPGLREVNPDARQNLDAALEAESHVVTINLPPLTDRDEMTLVSRKMSLSRGLDSHTK